MSLGIFLQQLESTGQLRRVSVAVSTDLEIAELTDRQSKSEGGGRALLFEHTGTDFPVVTNMMGSKARICKALRVNDLGEIEARIDTLLSGVMSPKRSLWDKLSLLPTLSEVAGFMPRHKSGVGACQAVEMPVDLSRLPVLKCAPHDGGRFFTLPLVHTIDPDTGAQNVGMYRMQVFDNQTTGMHWHKHKTGESHFLKYKALGRRMPVVVCLGGDPAYTYCATAPLPEGIDEYILAGFLRKKPVKLVKCATCAIEVPEDVDFVLEGYVDPAEAKVTEGPFGDHTGFYSLEDQYPLFHITRITHCRDAVFPATLVGIPPMEDFYFALATERIFLKPIQAVVAPELENLYMPAAGVAHNIAVATIRKTYAGQAFKVASALWGAGQMSFNKFCVLFSHDGVSFGDPVYNVLRQLRLALPSFDPSQDTVCVRGTLDVLDHAAPTVGYGGKMMFDLTTKTTQEGARTQSPAPVEHSVGRLFADYFTVIINNPDQLPQAAQTGAKLVVLFDKNIPLHSDPETLVWLAAANCDPARDISLVGVAPHQSLQIDARAKVDLLPRHPNVVCMSREVIQTVDARWPAYAIGDLIPSPSLKYLHLQCSNSAAIE